jgi:hypothetical protein
MPWVLIAAGLVAACTEEERIERYPIGVFMLQFADPVIAPELCSPGPAFISVGANVGFDRCQLESAHIQVRGESLFVSGVARCVIRSRRDGPLKPSGGNASVGTPPAFPNPQFLSLQLPELDPGDYTLCGDGLCGPLTVAPACRPAQVPKLYAYGSFGAWDSCPIFRTDFGFRFYQADGVELPAPAGLVRVFATPTCAAPYCETLCDPGLDGRIQIWTVDPVP